ncbi:tyrosine-protein phosphatase [Microbulbifer sp. YPW1]|uniref:tyrosine-protein phosphatase n=1 Tax=Microbulbifer sp. YPW1 TaxID=2745199 RepID=UPI00159A7321|nr:tyrosine-protein phosphatase [Microbulbifer sp. YPW1]QKX17276.1 tyrosine-protein phosphatase [Microbulbifer sp. YPW1]
MKNRFAYGVIAAAMTLALGGCAATDTLNSNALTAASAQQGTPANIASTVERTRVLPLEGGRNFRDLGGYQTKDGKTVKWGKLYRSGVLTHLTSDDYDYLRDREISTIVDFRSTDERTNEPTNWQAGSVMELTWDYDMGNWEQEFAKVMSKPDFAKEDLVGLMDQGYVGLVKQQTPHYRAMFQKLIESDEPLLFHCSAGKDRTGIGAALILTALGVDRETVKQDYMLSNQTLKGEKLMQLPEDASEKEKRMFAFFSQLPPEVRGVLAGVEVSWLETAFAEMERESGSVEAYIEQELDVDSAELALLRARLLH